MYWQTRYTGQIWSAEHGREWKLQLWSPSNFPSCNTTIFSWWRSNCSQIGLHCAFTYLTKLFHVLLLHYGWQECQGTAVKGFGIWKPAPRLAETKQYYPSLTLPALLSAKCLSPFPDGNWSSEKYFPSVFVPHSSVDRNFKTNGHFGGFKKQWNFMPLMNGQQELVLAALNGCTWN